MGILNVYPNIFNKKNSVFILIFFVPIFIGLAQNIYYASRHAITYNKPHIKAPPFVWPAGCQVKYYRPGDNISYFCSVYPIAKDDAKKYGLIRNKYSDNYRIGNDIVDINCVKKDCFVSFIEQNSFYQ